MEDAAQRKAKKDAYLAQIAAQKASKASNEPTLSNQNQGFFAAIPPTNAKPEFAAARPHAFHQAAPDAAMNARDQKWEEARMRFVGATQGGATVGVPPVALHMVREGPTGAPLFQPPQVRRDRSPSPSPVRIAPIVEHQEYNPAEWQRAGFPSEYAYALANGAMQPLHLQQQKQQQQQQHVQFGDHSGLEQRGRGEQQKAYADQLRQDAAAQQHLRQVQVQRIPQQQQQQQQQQRPQEGLFLGGPGEDMDLAMKKERQEEYRQDLLAQQQAKENRSPPRSINLPGGGGLLLGIGRTQQHDEKNLRQQQYAEQLRQDQKRGLEIEQQQWQQHGQNQIQMGEHVHAQQPHSFGDDDKAMKRAKQAAYALELGQQQQMQQFRQGPAGPRTLPGGGALAGFGSDSNAKDAKKNQQQQYAQELEYDMQRKNFEKQREKDQDKALYGGDNFNAGAQQKADKRAKQAQYAQELEEQMWNKEQQQAGNGSADLPAGGALAGFGGNFGQHDEKAANAKKNQQYAQDLDNDLQRKNFEKQREKAHDRALYGGNDENPAARGKADKRAKQEAYAQELEEQMWNKNNKPGSANLPGGGGLAIGSDGNAKDAKKNQQQQYAQELEYDMQRKNFEKQREKNQDRALYGGNADNAEVEKQSDKRAKQAAYAQELEEQMWNKNNKPGSANLPGGGNLAGFGGGFGANDKASQEKKNERYAAELENDIQRKKYEKEREKAQDRALYGGNSDEAVQKQSDKRAKQEAYAQELEEQMWNKNNKPGSANLPGGGGLAIGYSDDSGDAKRYQQQQYAHELESDMHRKKHEKEQEKAQDRALYGGNGEDAAAQKQLDKRAKQAAYAHELEEQMWNKNNKPGSANLPGGGGLAIGYDGNADEIKRNQQQQYAHELDNQMMNKKAVKDAEKAQDRALYGGGGGNGDDAHAAKLAKQREYAAQLQAQQHAKGLSAGGGPSSVQFGGNMGGIGSYEEVQQMQKRARQEEYARLLKQQELQRLAISANSNDSQKQVDALAVAMAGNLSPNGHQGEWAMGPLGVPVRRTLDVGNRGAQKAFSQSPQKIKLQAPAPQLMMPQGQPGFQQQQLFGAPGQQQLYGMPGMPQQQFQQQYPGIPDPYSRHQQHFGDPNANPAIMAAAQMGGDLRHLGGDIQDERDAQARLLSKQQQMALEDQIRMKKARLDAENKEQRQYEERTQERLDEERRQMQKQFEAEEKQAKMKIEEDNNRALAAQIEAKRMQKEDEERKEKEREAREEARIQREFEEIRQRELQEIQAEQDEHMRRQQKRDTSPFKDGKSQKASPRGLDVKTAVRVVQAVNLFGEGKHHTDEDEDEEEDAVQLKFAENAKEKFSPRVQQKIRLKNAARAVQAANIFGHYDGHQDGNADDPSQFDPQDDEEEEEAEAEAEALQPVARPVPPLQLKRTGSAPVAPKSSWMIPEATNTSARSVNSEYSGSSPLNSSQVLQKMSGKEMQNQQLILQLQRDAEKARQEIFNVRNEMQMLQRQVSEVSISKQDKDNMAKKADRQSKFMSNYEKKFGGSDNFDAERIDLGGSIESFPPRAVPPKPVPLPKKVYNKLVPASVDLVTKPEDREPAMGALAAAARGQRYQEDSGLRTETRFVYPDGGEYKPKPAVVPIEKDSWLKLDPPFPSEQLQKNMKEEKLVQYMIAAAQARGAAEKAAQERPTFSSSQPSSPRIKFNEKEDQDRMAVEAEAELNKYMKKAWQQQPNFNDDSASEDGDFALSSVLARNRNKWAVLKDFDDENNDIEALGALIRGLDGKRSRPSSASTVGSIATARSAHAHDGQRRGEKVIGRSSTAGSSRPVSDQRLKRDYADMSAYGALMRRSSGQHVVGGEGGGGMYGL